MSTATATRPRGTFSASVCAELDLLGRWQPGSTLRLWNGESRSFIGAKESRVGTGPHAGWLPSPLLYLVEGVTGTLSPWRADLVTSAGKASVAGVRFTIPRIGKPRSGLLPGDLIPDRAAFAAASARADAVAPPSVIVTTDESMTVLWSLAFPVPAAEAADLSKQIAAAVGADAAEWVPLHGFRFGTEDAACLEFIDAGRVYTCKELAAKAAEKGEVR